MVHTPVSKASAGSNRRFSMYTARFFSTQLGRAALISIAAMMALNVAVATRPGALALSAAAPQVVASSAAITGELA
jgi:hypothetical protein